MEKQLILNMRRYSYKDYSVLCSERKTR